MGSLGRFIRAERCLDGSRDERRGYNRKLNGERVGEGRMAWESDELMCYKGKKREEEKKGKGRKGKNERNGKEEGKKGKEGKRRGRKDIFKIINSIFICCRFINK